MQQVEKIMTFTYRLIRYSLGMKLSELKKFKRANDLKILH